MKLPDKHKVVQRGEHAFHASYLAVESFAGHPPLSWLALGILVFVVADAALHLFGGE